MDFNTFLISVFCLIDDWLTNMNVKLRQRGPNTTLDDSEVLTIEIIGAFLGLDKFSPWLVEWLRVSLRKTPPRKIPEDR